jgi:mannose-6-phosphate isomerase
MHAITGTLKDYDWGPVDGLAEWAGVTGAPQAELWFGAHPSGPSLLRDARGRTLADEVGADRVPLLVKLLCAGSPLSIQVHPDALLAATGRFTDRVEKNEMVLALEPFSAHAGWRDADDAADVLGAAGVPAEIVADVRAGRRERAIAELFGLHPSRVGPCVDALAGAATAVGLDEASVEALDHVIATHPSDPGCLVAVLLEHTLLNPGDALYLPAGIVHSYVRGLGVEVMTSSDNVLRLGLTSKPVALEDGLRAIRDDRVPALFVGPIERVCPMEAPFSVQVIRDETAVCDGGYRLVLVVSGSAQVTCGEGVLSLKAGEAAAVTSDEPPVSVRIDGHGVIVREDAP